ncbi:MAG TPA: DUF2939 domain-containing protein [Allosphingosinicella sp.]|nr:DUF2939 domain-containing protein [Allosphingosinicella sp.]
MRKVYVAGGAALLLILAGAGGWYWASPGLTVKSMVEAAQANDEARFSSYVDYTALRTDMKTELTTRLQEEAKRDGSEEAKLGLAMGMAVMGPLVDRMVSPSGMKQAFANLANEQAAAKGKSNGKTEQADPQIRRMGLNRFIITGKDTPDSGLVFERRGLSWKLAGIDLPPLSPETAARPAPAPR